MAQTVTLTSKRQATFPAKLCEEMAVAPGDKLVLERSEFKGKPVWLIVSQKSMDKPWFGSLKKYAKNKSHDIHDIRSSIGNSKGAEKQ